jgi:hypothetical protein
MRIRLRVAIAVLSIMLVAGRLLCAEDEKSIETLMGLSIQKYLEGDNKQAITYLDELLTRQSDHKRARDLLEKSILRLAEDIKIRESFSTDMAFMEMGMKYLQKSDRAGRAMEDLRSAMGIKTQQKKEEPARKEEEVSREKKKAPPRVERKSEEKSVKPRLAMPDPEYKKMVGRLNTYIKRLENKISQITVSGASGIMSEVGEMKNKIDRINDVLARIEKKPDDKSGLTAGILFLAVVVIVGGFAGIYLTLKSENVRLFKSITKERQTVEELKSTYNKDTEELAKKLIQYGKSYQRADYLEKNWERVFNILERLTRGGSTDRVVLKDDPSGRKAVTGVDPRTRARADSVEVIAEIFRDSSKAREMLGPFLDDEDNRTRANAAVAYHRYDPEKARLVIQDMAASEDKWMRLSAAWALGEIKDTISSKILEQLLDDSDTQVKNRARGSLEKIMEDRSKEDGATG